jgi:hypothetical protein
VHELVFNRVDYMFHILIYIQQDATLHNLFYRKTALHVSDGTSTHHQRFKLLPAASGR